MTWPLDEAASWFDLAPADVAALTGLTGAIAGDTAARAWVTGIADRLGDAIGRASRIAGLEAEIAAPPDRPTPSEQRYLPLLALAAAQPAATAFMRSRGIDNGVAAATLADVGRTVRKNRAWFGRPGLDAELAIWLVRHLHGALYQLGRLQFERSGLGTTTAGRIRASGVDATPGEAVLSLHIPAGLGPLSPQACDDALARAQQFFPAHFPDEHPRFAVCVSWLLDDQLAAYLPAGSNIVAFQRRFTAGVADGGAKHDVVVRRFVFGEAVTPLDEQPRTTSLERAVHDLIDAGRHFRTVRGWFPLS